MKLPETQANERGVALLLTLGVLSLLLILTMSFAFTARTELLASEVNADMVKARLLCESGLERVLGFLSFSFDGTEPEDVFPATSGELFTDTNASSGPGSATDWEGRSYMYSTRGTPDQNGIESALATDIGFAFIPQRTNAEITDSDELPDVSWQHLEDSDGDLIGRIAFIVVDESGKLDPNKVVTQDEGNENRIGVDPEEINIANALPSDITATDLEPGATRWFSWRHLQRGSGIDASDAESSLHSVFPWSYDVEAWWRDDNSNGQWDSGEDKPQYDLDGLASATVANLTSTTPPSDYFSSSPPPTATNVLRLSKMEDASGNSVSKQVAANLIDYCDDESGPIETTNDYTSLDDVSFCGLEEVPYINEVLLKVKMSDGADPNSDRKITVTPSVELINMWGNNRTVERLEMEVDIEFVDDGTTETETLSWDYSSSETVTANSYASFESLSSESYTWSPPSPSDSVSDFTFKAVRVAIGRVSGSISSSSLWDVGLVSESDATDLTSTNAATPGDERETTAEVKDPRANMRENDWHWRAFDDADTYSLGDVNSVSDPSSPMELGYTDYDAETTNDPADGISTAYIRNAPMEGVWELGAIHRGEPWRTINLKGYGVTGRYGDYDADSDGTIDPDERGGDGRILDQVKIGDQTEVYGRVNVNSPVLAVWTAVLQDVQVGATYNTPASGGTALNDTQAETLADDADANEENTVLEVNGTYAGGAFAGRGGIAAVPDLANGAVVTQDTDREQEEIIGKVAHLLTARQNYFNVIVVAQALQDIGGNTSNRSILVTKSDGSDTNVNILAEQKIKAVVYRDAFRNEFEVKRYEFLED